MVGTQRMPTSRPGRDRIRSAVQNLVPVEGTLSLLTENFPKPHIQVIEGAGAVTGKARSVHDGERFGFQVGELLQVLRRQRRVNC